MTDDVRKKLKAAGRRYGKTQAAQTQALDDLRAAITAAADAGMPKTEIADAAGVHRVTVYKMINAGS
jgi:DNA invertase Pin-like site-specific DNA recombinase